ncbi:MAG: hypothetical protein BGN88_11285 [Clostridiales bacterium 43-6]|nr:MAG: hypothetical protein BGN88_11285 [Clostridiales bacterium 43-6]
MVKRLILPLVLIMVIGGLGVSVINLSSGRYLDNLQIKDISGDRAVLNPIAIRGVLSDDITQTSFEFTGNGIKKKFSMVTNEDAFALYRYQSPSVSTDVLPVMEMAPDANVEKVKLNTEDNGRENGEYRFDKALVSYKITGRFPKSKPATLKTQVVHRDELIQPYTEFPDGKEIKGSINGGYPTLFDTKFIVETENKVYLYTFTDSDCTGYGGVYDITDCYNGKKNGGEQELPNLAPVDLEGGKIQIEGLEAVDNRLVYILVKNRMVYIRPYNLITRQFEKDIEICPVPKGNTIKRGYDVTNKYYGFTQSDDSETIHSQFVETEVMGSNLCLAVKSDFATGNSFNYLNGATTSFYAVDLMKQNVLEAVSNILIDERSIMLSNTKMVYKNNILFALQRYRAAVNGKTTETHVKIMAFQKGLCIYEGEIRSDIDEDYQFQEYDTRSTYRLYMRDYYFLELK